MKIQEVANAAVVRPERIRDWCRVITVSWYRVVFFRFRSIVSRFSKNQELARAANNEKRATINQLLIIHY
jgi:hypothetical protein